MREIIKMWKYPNMVILAMFCAAIYVAALVPFKSVPLIPGFTEIRPANLFPVLFGLLFGPAGAWGSAIGNLAADMFGTLSAGSFFGFAGNFFCAFIPYKIWGRLGIFISENPTPYIDSSKKLINFGICVVVSNTACAVIIAWGLDVLKLVPFATLSTIILLNNTVMSMVLGPIIMSVFYPKIKKWGLLWSDILKPQDISTPKQPGIPLIFVIVGSIGGLLTGLILSLTLAQQTISDTGFPASISANTCVQFGVLPFLVLMFYGATKI